MRAAGEGQQEKDSREVQQEKDSMERAAGKGQQENGEEDRRFRGGK